MGVVGEAVREEPSRADTLCWARGGRRRATLIVCPTSLVSHWVEQLDQHLHRGVDIKMKIHHGAGKAFYAADLEGQDVVITTYGVLAAEHVDGERSPGPLLTARWLRVVLDEGHHIKGFNTKAHKAAMQLQADRRWVVTGTPIQNNLMELWSLTTFLQFSVYSEKAGKADFKRLIEQPCLRGDNDKGFERLKVTLTFLTL